MNSQNCELNKPLCKVSLHEVFHYSNEKQTNIRRKRKGREKGLVRAVRFSEPFCVELSAKNWFKLKKKKSLASLRDQCLPYPGRVGIRTDWLEGITPN